jgi:hypothetical protein
MFRLIGYDKYHSQAGIIFVTVDLIGRSEIKNPVLCDVTTHWESIPQMTFEETVKRSDKKV